MSARERIKKTVEAAIPQLEIDTTRVMTDEEQEALRIQFEQKQADRLTAAKLGRDELRKRLNATVQRLAEPE